MTTEKKTVTLAEHVVETHRDTERLGKVVTGDIVSGDVVPEDEESTDVSEDKEEEEGSGSDS